MAKKNNTQAVAQATEQTPSEKFAAAYERIASLPAGAEGAFRGKDPTAPATPTQAAMLTRLGLVNDGEGKPIDFANVTKASAHAQIGAYKEAFPEFYAVAQTQAAAERAAGPKPYHVNKAEQNLPATYHQTIQLAETKGADGKPLRELADKSPLPTRAEVANTLNAVRTADPAAYEAGLRDANFKIAGQKHLAPSESQKNLAEAVNAKVSASLDPESLAKFKEKISLDVNPFVKGVPQKDAEGKAVKDADNKTVYEVEQRGSTMHSVAKALHDAKLAQPELYAEARKELNAGYYAGPSADAKIAAKEAQKAAEVAAKLGPAPVLAAPSAPAPSKSVEAEAGA